MHIRDLLHTAFHDVRVHTSRSLLTMLGIIIGVGAVVLMTGVGKSMEGVILGQISILGPKSMVIFPGKGPEGGTAAINPDYDSLTMRDVEALRTLTTVTSIAPAIMLSVTASRGRERASPLVVGATPAYYANQSITVRSGRLHEEAEEDAARAVAVIGSDIAEDLFAGQEPVGQRLEISGKRFTVIGVVEPVGTQFFQNLDERIVIPFSTARTMRQRDYVDAVTMQATGDFDDALDDVTFLLRTRHGIAATPDDPAKNDDFMVHTAEQAKDILGTVSLALTAFITMVASVSLIVGGIGIMNIMLVSVTERTREIGLRKALGARGRDILRQFLMEAVAVTALGTVIGLLAGMFLDWVIVLIAGRFLATYRFGLHPPAVAATVLMALGVGLGFGVYPARKAAALDPIDALRYE